MTTPTKLGLQGKGRWWSVFAFAAFACWGCDRGDDEVLSSDTLALREVAGDTSRYVGQRLTLVGEVDSVYGDRAFELEGNELFFDSSLLVLTRSPVRLSGRMLEDDDRVAVTGTVRNFVAPDLERELTRDLRPELEVEWNGRPAFIADSISRLSERSRWSEQEAELDGVLMGLTSTYYVSDPAALSGQRIELEGVPVRQRSPGGLWLGENHSDQIFVAVAPADGRKIPNVEAGERVDVTGIVRKMPSPDDAISRWHLDGSLAAQIEEELIYIEAQSVQQSERRRGTPRDGAGRF